jgi:HK97 family phage major capsid protein
MSENQKTPEVVMGEAFANAIEPALSGALSGLADSVKQQGEQIKSLIESQAEKKSVKDEFEAKSKEFDVKLEAEVKSMQAQIDELSAKKSVNVSGATQVDNFEQLAYQVKSASYGMMARGTDAYAMEGYAQKSLSYIKSFAKENPIFAKSYSLGSLIGQLEEKAIHNVADGALGGLLLNAPFMLDAFVETYSESVLRQHARVEFSPSIEVQQLNITKNSGATVVMPVQERLTQGSNAMIGLEKVMAIRVADKYQIQDSLRLAAANNMPLLLNSVGKFLREEIFFKFDLLYHSEGVTIEGGGRLEGIIPAIANQYEYQTNNPRGGDQFIKGKIAFVKSGNATSPTISSVKFLTKTLPSSVTAPKILCNASFATKLELLKDDNDNYIFYNGNGAALSQGSIGRICGLDVVVDHRMPENVAVYGDIRSFTITDCLGGFQIFDRPAVGDGLIDNVMGNAYSTSKITDYAKLRLYKIQI